MSLTSVLLPEPETPVTQVRTPERKRRVDVLQIVLPRSQDLEGSAVGRAALGRRRNAARSRQVLSGQRFRMLSHLSRGSAGHQSAAVATRPRTEIDQVIGGFHGVAVVLHDHHRVAQVAQPQQRVQQATVIACMQSNRGLVQDVEHAGQLRADLRGQPDALRLAAGERRCRPVEREIAEPDVIQEAQAILEFLEDRLGDAPPVAVERQGFDPMPGDAHRVGGPLGDRSAVDAHRQALGLEPRATARRTWRRIHQSADRAAYGFAGGLPVPALQVGDDTLPGAALDERRAAARAKFETHLLIAGALQHEPSDRRRQAAPRSGQRESIGFRDRTQRAAGPGRLGIAPRQQRAAGNAQRWIGDDPLGIDPEQGADALAFLAGAERRVEREAARLELGHAGSARGAGRTLAEQQVLGALLGHGEHAAAMAQRRLDRLGQSRSAARVHRQAIDHQLDVVALGLGQLRRLVQLDPGPVDAGAHEALATHGFELLLVFALATADQRRQQADAPAGVPGEQCVDDLLDAPALHARVAARTVLVAEAREQQPQVVVDLGDGGDRRPRIRPGPPLLDRDRRRQAFDRVDFGLLHLAQELARVRRERLDVATLAFGVQGVEGERGLAGPGHPGDHGQALARDAQRQVRQVVFTRATNRDVAQAPSPYRRRMAVGSRRRRRRGSGRGVPGPPGAGRSGDRGARGRHGTGDYTSPAQAAGGPSTVTRTGASPPGRDATHASRGRCRRTFPPPPRTGAR